MTNKTCAACGKEATFTNTLIFLRICENCMNTKKPYYKVSPELSDGINWSIIRTIEEVNELLRDWVENGADGKPIIQQVWMSPQQFESLADL